MERHAITADKISAIRVGFLPGTDAPLISTNPQTGLEGKFSVEYALAAAALDGELTLDSFTDAKVQRPAARALLSKVARYAIADERVYGLDARTELTVETAQGAFDLSIDRTPGSPAWPLTQQDRDAKFLDCAALAIGPTAARRLLDRAQALIDLDDISTLVAAAKGDPMQA